MDTQKTEMPSGGFPVQEKPADASLYGEQQQTVEESKCEYFKQLLFNLIMTNESVPGEILGQHTFDFDHTETFNSRIVDYCKAYYKDLDIKGKRVDPVFTRSGAIGVLITGNPWFELSDTDHATNLATFHQHPDSRIIAISDPINRELASAFRKYSRGKEFYLNKAADMPLDYTTAGKVFFICVSPPVALAYQTPVYVEGNVVVSGYQPPVPVGEFVREEFELRSEPTIEWDASIANYSFVWSENIDPTRSFYGDAITMAQGESKVHIKSTASRFREVHRFRDLPGKAVAMDGVLVVSLPINLADITKFSEPLYADGLPNPMIISVFVRHQAFSKKTYRGKPIGSYPLGSANISEEEIERNIPAEHFTRLLTISSGQEHERLVRPAAPTSFVG